MGILKNGVFACTEASSRDSEENENLRVGGQNKQPNKNSASAHVLSAGLGHSGAQRS